jgi:hypothetical protein
MNIKKITLTVTVLIDDNLSDVEAIGNYSLETIASEIEQGDWLGSWNVDSIDDVPDDKVQEECEALGNDGTFFGSDDEEEVPDELA